MDYFYNIYKPLAQFHSPINPTAANRPAEVIRSVFDLSTQK